MFFRKRLMELQPRRQSSRLEKLKHQKEVEKQAEEQKLQSELTKKDDKDQKEKERRDRYEVFHLAGINSSFQLQQHFHYCKYF